MNGVTAVYGNSVSLNMLRVVSTRISPFHVSRTIGPAGLRYYSQATAPNGTQLADAVTIPGVKRPLHALWLRDHCRCAKCFFAATSQRSIATADIAVDLQAETVSQEGEDVIVKWSDGHESTYHTSFIRNVVEGKEEGPKANQSKHNRILWNVERVNSVASPDVDYASLMSEDKETEIKAQVSLFKNLWTMGYAFIQSVPACPTKTEEMAARIGPIMNTLYGSFYDFVPDLEYEDTAYTNFELLAHTDTTYLHQPAGLQMFHILEAKNVVGGESTLTDGFFITNSLKQNDPELYEFMKRQTVKFHFKDHHNNMKTEYPVITEDKHGDIQHIRWNDDDRDVQDHVESKDLDSFYRAVRTWVKMCNDPSNQYTFSLQPGTALIFDNWRVMHGRKEFTGFRRMSGCYHARSDFLSKLRHYGIIA